MCGPSRSWAHFIVLLLCFHIVHSRKNSTTTPYERASLRDLSYLVQDESYCSFVSKKCGWVTSDHWFWYDNGDFDLQLDGPSEDDRFPTSLISYLGLENTTDTTFNKTFTSPKFLELDHGVACFTFKYYSEIYGTEDDGIHLSMIDPASQNKTEIWSGLNIDMDEWIEGQVNVRTDSRFNLEFMISGSNGFAAIKDLFFQKDPCKEPLCDFESGLCDGWKLSSFQIIKASKTRFQHRLDHTTRSGFGSFAYIDMKTLIDNQNLHVTAESPIIGTRGTQCLTFSLMRSLRDYSMKLFVKNVQTDAAQPIWQSNSSHLLDDWLTIHIDLRIDSDIQLIFQVFPSADAQGLVAIDDISFFPDACAPPVSCKFEGSYCDWHQDINSTFHWSIGKGRVHYADKLINLGEAIGSRSYLYTDFTILPKNSAPVSMQLISQTVEADYFKNAASCLITDINVGFIDDAGEFTIEKRSHHDESHVLWRFDPKTMKLNDSLKAVKIYVPHSPTNVPFRFVLNVKTQSPSTRVSIFSIDYKDVSACFGAPGMPTVSTLSTISPTPTKDPLATLKCDFNEDNTCGWKSSEGDSNFTLTEGAWSSHVPDKYRPHYDHTYGGALGGYVIAYADKSSGVVDDATLTGKFPMGSTDSLMCIDFAYFYYISGRGSGAKLTADNGEVSKVLWIAPPGISNQWNVVRFTFEPNGVKYSSLTFRTSLVNGALALDDINISLGPCDETISMKRDRVCDFEDGTSCDFTQFFVPNVPNFKVYDGTKINNLPDHSTGTPNGHFYGISFADLPADQKPFDDEIVTQSHHINFRKLDINCVQFSYYSSNVVQSIAEFGYEIREVVSDLTKSEEIIKNWKISGSTDKLWFTHHVEVTWTTDSYITFFIKVNNLEYAKQNETNIFFDDITLSTSSCPQRQCDFEQNTCFLEPIPMAPNPNRAYAGYMVNRDVNSTFASSFVIDLVSGYFHMFSHFQDQTVGLMKANGEPGGNMLLLTSDERWKVAVLVTDRYVVNEFVDEMQVCLSFFMNKNEKASYVQVLVGSSRSDQLTLIYTTDRLKTDGWKKVELLAKAQSNVTLDLYFYIVGFAAEPGSFVALDQVSVDDHCNQKPDNVPSTKATIGSTTPGFFNTQFKCKSDDTMIPMEKVCNYINDCDDGSDEIVCGKCSFENHDLCGYQNLPESLSIQWDFNDNYPETQSDSYKAYLVLHNDHNYDFEVDLHEPLTASIESNTINQSYSGCMLSLSYRPNGTHIDQNTFEIYIANHDNDAEVVIYQNDIDVLESMEWTDISIMIGRIPARFKIGFRGVIASNSFESHSIYHVDTRSCSPPIPASNPSTCNLPGDFLCKNNVCISSEDHCNLNDDCGDRSDEVDCDPNLLTDFTNGFNNWTPDPVPAQNVDALKIKSTQTIPNYKFGPLYDHTTGLMGTTGYFAIFRPEKDSKKQLIGASIQSVPFRMKPNCRVSFYYFTNTPPNYITVKRLVLNQQSTNNIETISLKPNTWTKVEPRMTYDSDTTIYSLSIHALLLNDQAKAIPYVAIDDIAFSKECELLPNSDAPGLSTLPPDDCQTFKCNNTKNTEICLLPEQICDFVNDCKQEEDEKYCGSCDFDDNSFCRWTVEQRDSLWKIQQPAYTAEAPLFKTDVNDNKDGGYLYGWRATSTVDKSDSRFARIVSPMLNAPTSDSCTFRFSHRSQAKNVLKVGIQSAERNTKPEYLFEGNENSDYFWNSYSVSIGARPKGFQLFIEGYSDHRIGSYMNTFLDNFMLTDCISNTTIKEDKVSCDFEDNFCGWINIISQNMNGYRRSLSWIRLATDEFEPGNDHTSLLEPRHNHSGTWIGLVPHEDSISYLRTFTPIPAGQDYCFSFWHYIVSQQTYGRLFLYSTETISLPNIISEISEKGQTLLFKSRKIQERNWKQKMIYLEPSEKKRYLVFGADVKERAVLALDDFVLTPGNCSQFQSPGSCDFQMDFCAWQVDNKQWSREKGQIRGHSAEGYERYYIKQTAAEKEEVKMGLNIYELNEFKQESTLRTMCIRIFYILQGNDGHTEENDTYIGVRAVEEGSTITSSINITQEQVFLENNELNWAMLTFDFLAKPTTILEIFGKRQSKDSKIYLDDIILHNQRCETGGGCNFENDMCGWENVAYDEVKEIGAFTRFQPNNKWQNGRYLKVDTTTRSENGHYALLSVFNRKARAQVFRSPMIHSVGPKICFSMNYFGQTSVYQEKFMKVSLSSLTNKDFTPIVVRANSTKLGWTRFAHTFIDVPHYFIIHIQFEDEVTYESDIGIDDIHITYLSCDDDKPNKNPVIPDEEKKLDCSFELGENCIWDFKDEWSIGNFTDQKDIYAPNRDHTTGLPSGRYALAKDNNEFQSSSQFDSEQILKMDKDRCLTFWYYEDTEDDYYLTVHATTGEGQRLMTKLKSQIESRRKWSLIKVDLPLPFEGANFNLSYGLSIDYCFDCNNQKPDYNGPVIGREFGRFAIDDIRVRPGLCKHEYNYVYTFEESFEDLRVENIKPINNDAVTRFAPYGHQFDNVPHVDHTTGTEFGNFMLFRVSQKNKNIFLKNTLEVVNIDPDVDGVKCVRFAYQLFGNVTLKAFAFADAQYDFDYDNSNVSLIWTVQNPTPQDMWTIAEFDKYKIFRHKVVLYMASPGIVGNMIAIDDLVIRNHKCQPIMNCDFEESNTCSYTSYPMSDGSVNYNFGLMTAPASDPKWPGPVYDHTTREFGGSYLYLTSYRALNATSARHGRMVSGPRNVTPGQSYCLSMFTRLNTKDLTLKLSILRLGNGFTDSNRVVEVLTLSNVQQQIWTSLSVNLNETTNSNANQIQLIIEGMIEEHSTGAIAIDDISVQDGVCVDDSKNGDLICEDGTSLTANQICDFVKDCPSGLDEASCGTCSFEQGLCGWNNITLNPATGKFGLVGVATLNQKQLKNAPSTDGSSNTQGHYLLVRAEIGRDTKTRAEIATNPRQDLFRFKRAFSTCEMSFDVYIQTGTSPRLNIKVGTSMAEASSIYVVDETTTQRQWQRVHVHIGYRWAPFIVDMSAYSGRTDVVAIDNVKFDHCQLPENKTSCDTTTQFRCEKYGFCIDQDSVCDFVDDCGDSSDEDMTQLCHSIRAKCDFENSLASCHIKDETNKSSSVQWRQYSYRKVDANQARSGYEPQVDDTTRTQFGTSFLLAPNVKMPTTFTGTFSTPMMSSKFDAPCKMRFFYYIHDSFTKVQKSQITVRMRYATKLEPEDDIIQTISVDNKLQQRWNKQVILLNDVDPFQVIITGTLGTSKARIAIDDISFDFNCLTSDAQPYNPAATTKAPTDGPETTVPPSPTAEQTTPKPAYHNGKNDSPGHGKAIALGITVPLVIIFVAIGAFFWMKKRQSDRRSEDRIAFSLTRLSKKYS